MYHDFYYIKQLHDPSFVSKRCHNFKISNPLIEYYRDHQFCHFSTRKSLPGTWFSLEKWYSRERAILHLSICEIIFWSKLKLRVFTAENIYCSRVIYDLWTCSCVDEYKRELWQHLKLWHKFASFRQFKHIKRF